MVFKSYHKLGILVSVIIIGLFFFSSITMANDFVLAEGRTLLMLDLQNNSADVDFYTLQFTIASNADNAYQTESVIRINDLFFFEDGLSPGKTEEFYNYYPDTTDVLPVQQKLILLTDQNNQKWELVLSFNKDGTTDYLRTSLAKVPMQYLDGYPVKEKVKKPAPSATKENIEKKESYKIIEEEAISYRTNVCYLTDETPFVPSNHCEYFEAAQFATIDTVSSDFIVPIKELLAKYDGSEGDVIDESKPTPAAGVTVIPTKAPEAVDELSPVIERNSTEEVSSGKVVVPQDYAERVSISPLSPKYLPLFYPDFLYASFAGPDVDLLYEDFEGSWPGPWTAWDANPSSGDDYWGDNSSQSYTGGWSGWAADEGTQTLKIFDPYESFEALLLDGWNYADVEPLSGSDTWGHSFSKKTAGLGSAYAAGNSSTGWNSKYDDNMKSLLYSGYYYDASQWESATLTYKVWYDTEQDLDWVTPIFSSDGGSNFTYQNSWKKTGASGGWTPFTVSVPSSYLTSQFTLGFYFFSNGTTAKEGAYIDEVALNYVKKNIYVEKYDNSQDAYLKSGLINLSSVVNPELEYRLRPGMDGTDYFVAQISTNGTSWQDLYTSTSTSTSWSLKSSDLSAYANQSAYIRFLFHSNSTGNSSTGPYIDNVRVHGDDKLPNGSVCTYSGECETNNCSSAPTKYDLTCVQDGSIQVKVTKKEYPQVCGGVEINPTSTITNPSCASGYICDIDLSQNNQSSSSTSQICKKSLYQSCASSSECWNDNGSGSSNVDCKGSPSICTTGNLGTQCANASQCDSGLVCNNGLCSDGAGVGDACTKDTDCQSKICEYTSGSSGVCKSTHSPKLDITDSWVESNSNNESSADDGRLFAGETVYPISKQLRESTDMICYDFDGDGDYDACYYDSNGCNGSGCSASSCNVSGFTIPQSVSSSKKWACDIDSGAGCKVGVDNGTLAQICTGASCSVSTASPIFSNEVKAVGFADCDNSDNLKEQYAINGVQFVDSHYTVIKPKYALCEKAYDPITEELVLNNLNYSSAGFNGIGDDEYFDYTCTGVTKACDILSDEQEIFTANGVIPNPCKTIPNQSCTQNSDCLYNSCNTSINKCNVGIGIEGILRDEFENPIVGKQIKLTSCGSGDAVLKTSTTDLKGKFKFYYVPGNYKLKSSSSWSTEITYVFPEGPCYSYGEGFHDIWLELYTKANIHGNAVNPQGFASVGLDLEAATCQNVSMDSDTTDSQGNFSLNSDAGYQKVLVDLNGTKYPLTDASGNACLFQYGNVDLGTQVITDNCPLYNNTCSDDNTRLFDCTNDSLKGCSCKSQYCEAGCTENAPVCNPIGTGTFKVQVLDLNGNAVPLAPVFVDSQSVGKTNGFGKKDANVKHGSHTIKVVCPNASTIYQSKTSYINSDTKHEAFKLNCPISPKSKVSVNVETTDGYPIGNVYVFLDEEFPEKALTNGFGTATFTAEYGNHDIILAYLVEDGVPGSYQLSIPLVVDSAEETIHHTLILPGDPGFSSSGAQPISSTIAPVVILGALTVLDIASMAWDAYDYCSCVYPGSDASQLVTQCFYDLSLCKVGKIALGEQACRDAFQEISSNDPVGKCDAQFGTLALGVGLTIIPGNEIVNLSVKGTKLAKGILHLDEAAEVVKLTSGKFSYLKFPKASLVKVSDTLYKYTIDGFNYIASPIASGIDGKPIMKGVVEVIDNPIEMIGAGGLGAEVLVKKAGFGSEKIFKDIIGKNLGGFTFSKSLMIKFYDAFGKIKLSSLNAIEVSKLEDKVVEYIKKGQLNDVKGKIGEALVGSYPKFVNKLKTFNLKIPGSEIDWVLTNGDLVQVKYTSILKLKQTDSIAYKKELGKYADQLVATYNYDSTAKIHFVLAEETTQTVKDELEEDLKQAIINTQSPFDMSNLIVEGVD